MTNFSMKYLNSMTNSMNHHFHKNPSSNRSAIGKQPIIVRKSISHSNSANRVKHIKKSSIVNPSSSIASSMATSISSSNEDKSSSSSSSKGNSTDNGNKNGNNGSNQITLQNTSHHDNSSANGNGGNHNNHSKALNETKKMTHQENMNHISHLLNMANVEMPNGNVPHKPSTKIFKHERHHTYNNGAKFAGSDLIHLHYRGQNNKPTPDTKRKLEDYWKHDPHNPKFNLGGAGMN